MSFVLGRKFEKAKQNKNIHGDRSIKNFFVKEHGKITFIFMAI